MRLHPRPESGRVGSAHGFATMTSIYQALPRTADSGVSSNDDVGASVFDVPECDNIDAMDDSVEAIFDAEHARYDLAVAADGACAADFPFVGPHLYLI